MISISFHVHIPRHEIAPHMKEIKSGNIICIVSVAALHGSRINMHYRASKAEQGVPLRRMGTTKDIARAELFLASDESLYITGDSLFVSGGSGLVEPGGGPRHTN